MVLLAGTVIAATYDYVVRKDASPVRIPDLKHLLSTMTAAIKSG
ncbi:MAG: hypothetical protein FD149_1472 [Rhodospirillaceae bacterium]|nr:MAG: hypothetical protein FD149_1472 [Rhodospirillaceae bacterium]